VRIQTEFVQTQLKSLNEQAKDLGETATKVATDAFKGLSLTEQPEERKQPKATS
jgi:hypothetical protein